MEHKKVDVACSIYLVTIISRSGHIYPEVWHREETKPKITAVIEVRKEA